MQRLFDDLIRNVWTVKVAGIDVIYPERDGFSQHRNCSLPVARRPEDARARKLHRTVAHARDGHAGSHRERSAQGIRPCHSTVPTTILEKFCFLFAETDFV